MGEIDLAYLIKGHELAVHPTKDERSAFISITHVCQSSSMCDLPLIRLIFPREVGSHMRVISLDFSESAILLAV